MIPNKAQFKSMLPASVAGEKNMSEGFAALDKLMNDKKPMTAAKKKAIDAAHAKVEKGRGE